MPIEIKDWDRGLGLFIRGWEVTIEGELVDKLQKHLMQDKEKLKRYRYSLSDYTAITKTDISTATVESTADFLLSVADINPDVIAATVANQDVLFGLSRMGEILRDKASWEEMVFRNMEDAKNWIQKRVKEKYGIETLTFK
ncbi:MAG: hypothetical protein JRJ27_22050 [Deltaproteobacteria bacterium]|nr:hypothetical protein [Deltaproteobacteria bacterium]